MPLKGCCCTVVQHRAQAAGTSDLSMLGFPTKFSLNKVRKTFENLMYFRPHILPHFRRNFCKNFRFLLNIENDFCYLSKMLFHFTSSPEAPILGYLHFQESGGEKMFFFLKVYSLVCKYTGCPKHT